MKFKRPQSAPLACAIGVLVFVFILRFWQPAFLERLELMTYDLRLRVAQRFPMPAVTNLVFLSMEDSSIEAVRTNAFGYRFGLYWPRQVYGRAVEELSAQNAKLIAFDVVFGELREDHPAVQLANGGLVESDDFFARKMRLAGNVILARTPETCPPDLFATNAVTLGDISTEKDTDGILRRVKAFRDFRVWHPLISTLAAMPEISADLDNPHFRAGKILLPQAGSTNFVTIPVDAENTFAVADLLGRVPRGWAPRAKAFTIQRVWHLGIVLAAQTLDLDLSQPHVDLRAGRIVLRSSSGLERVLPVDADGYFWVNWGLKVPRIPIETVLAQDQQRLRGETNGLRDDFRGKIVVIGSAAQGNDLSDRGATPLSKDTFLVSKHWNVANSVITGKFIHRLTLMEEIFLIVMLGTLTALATWQLRAVAASISVLLLIGAYLALAFAVFIHSRLWVPIFYPLVGAVMLQHLLLMTHRIYFEEQDKRRVKSLFSKMISPEIMNELLQADKLALGGTHREVTIFFADVRGFTSLTDQMQESVAEFIRSNNVEIEIAERHFEESARETLEIVNLYLSVVAEAVKKNGGILDKYIGDCVMAFWNAPVPEETHAVCAVRAAIDSQRAIHRLNQKREEENPFREQENRGRATTKQPPKPLHSALYLGTGINTGYVTVGLMGSDEHGFNYTVFGREVNLASRLEGLSGSGRIIISDLTYFQLLRHAPELAATCKELFPEKVKGFREAVRIYEVPWQVPEKPD